MRAAIVSIAKSVLSATPLRRYFFPYYAYNMTPPQLVLLCEQLKHTRETPGIIVEIGCSNGITTVFLNKFMDAEGIDKPDVTIDTFSGFVEADIRYEVDRRGKQPSFFHGFSANRQK